MGILTRELERTFLGERSPPVQDWFADGGLVPRPMSADCPTCGLPVGPGEVQPDPHGRPRCASCRGSRPAWDLFLRLASHEDAWRRSIHLTKFSRHRRLGHALGARLGERVATKLRDIGVDPTRAVLCPMPTTLRRRLARGVDHAGVLANGAAWSAGLGVHRLLSRRHRPSQLDVHASLRSRNMAGAFRARDRRVARLLARMGPGPVVIVVIDDVRTTGATMRSACRALRAGLRRSGGPEGFQAVQVWAAVVATADPNPGGPDGGGALAGSDTPAPGRDGAI